MTKHVRIGVYLSGSCQLLDVAAVDVLAVMSKEYLEPLSLVPRHVVAIAPHVSIVYISPPDQKGEVPLTAGMVIKTHHTYLDREVAPGTLDIIAVPGPDPEKPIDRAGAQWLKRHFDTGKVDVLSVCTGLYVCATAGIADGRRASGPRGMQKDLMDKFPKIKLVGEQYRWIQDGNLWSSGGVTNGNDLMAAYARSGKYWDRSIAELGALMTDVGDRGQDYNEGPTTFMFGLVWQLIRAWFSGFGSQGEKSKKKA